MTNWYCNNCSAYKDSWAEHQSYKPNETYRRDIRCYSCDGWNLTYTSSQKSRYKELVKEKTSISGSVEEVERFSTWWSNNIATVVVYYGGYYRVFLLVYDPVYSTYRPAVFPESYDCSYWGEYSRENFNSSSSAKGEASWLRDKLISSSSKYYDNPILLIHPNSDCSRSFNTFVTSPYVANEQVGTSTKTTDIPLFYVNYSSSTPTDLNKHFRPLDIVQVKCVDNWVGKRFYHVGFYLGNDKVCHFSRENDAVEATGWDGFLRNTTRKIVRYHPIVPFKDYRDVIRQAVWAKDNGFRRGNYNLPNRNCEHFANMLVYGIDFSQQVREREGELIAKATVQGSGLGVVGGVAGGASIALAPFTFGLSLIPGAMVVGGSVAGIVDNAERHGTLNNNKTEICLESEIRNTNNRLGRKSDWETEKYEEQYLQEVPPKEYCQII